LEHLVTALGLGECVTLTGSVSQAALVSYYRAADVFVCLSQHEGFCVPLLEAMWHAVPVVALVSSAVPETLGPAGVLLPSRPGGGPAGSALVAAAVHRVLDDRSLRGALIAAGRARAQDFSLDGSRRRFLEAITSVVGEI
jgi:glycosyltransferase involved in cell wall biosynthesis